MIPLFPRFKKLELNDKKDIENITKKYPPYSDFNFVSLWSYNTEDDVLISLLNKNYVIKMRDYLTNEQFYSFLGDKNFVETCTKLISKAKKEKIRTKLSLIPELNLKDNNETLKLFSIEEDMDNFDYVLSLNLIANLKGKKLSNKRNMVNRFNKSYPNCITKSIDISQSSTQKQVFIVASEWLSQKKDCPEEDAQHEKIAIGRLLNASSKLNMISIGIYDNNRMIGFACAEILDRHYSIFHFVKGNTSYVGIFDKLYSELARELIKTGIKYINIEQDLGILGLRFSKQQWNPVFYLKKYTISMRS